MVCFVTCHLVFLELMPLGFSFSEMVRENNVWIKPRRRPKRARVATVACSLVQVSNAGQPDIYFKIRNSAPLHKLMRVYCLETGRVLHETAFGCMGVGLHKSDTIEQFVANLPLCKRDCIVYHDGMMNFEFRAIKRA